MSFFIWRLSRSAMIPKPFFCVTKQVRRILPMPVRSVRRHRYWCCCLHWRHVGRISWSQVLWKTLYLNMAKVNWPVRLIVRAPIVYGEADRDGVAMYASIQNYGLHLVPGLTENYYSLIYAGDLAIACELIARQGRRVTTDPDSTTGIYYPAAMQNHTFAGFGRAIAHGMDKKEPKIVRVPALVIWFVAALTEIGSRISGSNGLVNRDKALEANAGSWTCNSTRLQQDTGFIAGTSLEQGLKKTILWYRQAGWLNS